jgi:D-aminoacyl-tRNA deacylase
MFQGTKIFEAEISNRKVMLVTLNQESIRAQTLPNSFSDIEVIIFISKHSSLSGTPTLSVHTPGNLGDAEMGGISRCVSVSPPHAMLETLKAMMRLKEKMQLQYEVCYEGTHHGPSLNVPTMFAELGSSSAQWTDVNAAEAVGHAVMEATSKPGVSSVKAVLGIGGLHYNGKFTKLALENDLAFGHIIPKYAIPHVNVETLKQCVERTLGGVESAVLDWKGIKGEDKTPIVTMLKEIGLRYEKV